MNSSGKAFGICLAIVGIVGGSGMAAYMLLNSNAGAEQKIVVDDIKEETPISKRQVSTNDDEASAVSARDGLNPTALFTYEIYNEMTDTSDSINGPIPKELVGKQMVDVKEFYSDWQVLSFSNDEVLLRKIIGEFDDERYIVSVYDGCVVVYYENMEDGIYMMTDIETSGLDHNRQVLLNDGIYVEGKERLNRILEDYGS